MTMNLIYKLRKYNSWHGQKLQMYREVHIIASYLFVLKVHSYTYTCFRENRYLLFLTENYSALGILKQNKLIDQDSLVLFGSSFPKDINYTQVMILVLCVT